MSENVQRQHPENNRMHIYAYNLRISIWLSDHDFVVKIHPFLALLLGKKKLPDQLGRGWPPPHLNIFLQSTPSLHTSPKTGPN